MTTARIVFYDPQSRTYHLPHEHAAWLVEGAGPDNLARIMRFLPQLVEVEQGIIRCFREGGGLSYARHAARSDRAPCGGSRCAAPGGR